MVSLSTGSLTVTAARCVAWFHLQLYPWLNPKFPTSDHCPSCKHKQPCHHGPRIIFTGCRNIWSPIPGSRRSWRGECPRVRLHDYEAWSESRVVPVGEVSNVTCKCACLSHTAPSALPTIPASRDCGWKLAKTSVAAGALSLDASKTNSG